MRTRTVCILLLFALAAPACCDDSGTGRKNEEGFQWGSAIWQSFLSVALADGVRVATQADTRQAIEGPFWQNYTDSIQNLHGWNDGDGFFTSYVLHPMEGSAAGYIERQNDPRYRDVEFGKSQRYWISCMRALAFSTAYSIVWSATPFGEPGVGNVELHNKPGVVDLVGTQTMGLGWMIGEDAIDRYVIRRIEWRVRNPIVRALARSVLNPTRSYANVMAFRRPWHRDDRPGVIYEMPPKSGFLARAASEQKFSGRAWPENAAFELMAAPELQRYTGRVGSNCLGTAGEAAVKVSSTFDAVFEIDGCELSNLGKDVSGDSLTYAFGPRWRFRTATKWTPFLEVLAGGVKIAHVTYYPEKEQRLTEEAKEQNKIPPDWADYHSEVDTNGFTLLGQAGVSYKVSELISWRIGSIGYQRSWTLDRLDGLDYNQGLRFSTGVAITMGPWSK